MIRLAATVAATLLGATLPAAAPPAAAPPAAAATRVPVLAQIDLPHSYYWREMYIPQVTSGPSAAAFSPDGSEAVFSMAGSLWRQALGSDDAEELTHGPGYDLQPDWSSDGRTVVFVRSHERTLQLWRIDLVSGRLQALTSDALGANLEPRLSPDGKRIAFVSTRGTGHLNLFVADLGTDGLGNVRALVPSRESKIDRYYYSTFDHAINPSFSPDGKRVYYVGNPEVAWGSGDIWSVAVDDPQDRQRVLVDETTWAARPELSPDGRRLLYSSYQGRQWHQLWLTTPDGRSPLPLTFGEFDRRNARWSADGERVLYISNESGNTSLWVQDLLDGKRMRIVPRDRLYRRTMASLDVSLRDADGTPLAARVSVLAADARYYVPDDRWAHADDFVHGQEPFERLYFHCYDRCSLTVPPGNATVTAMRGLETVPLVQTVAVPPAGRELQVQLEPLTLPERFGKYTSADLHVHMNYGGHYRQDAEGLAAQAQAEDLDVVYNLIVNKEQRIPDIGEFTPDARQIAGPNAALGPTTLFQGQEFHTSYWGHLGLLHLDQRPLLPDFSAYRHTALASPWPHNGAIADRAHEQHALVGYVHPYDWVIDPAREKSLTHALPVDVALGKADYLEVVSFADHRATAEVWYRLLNLGFRLPAGAGTDAMSNYASLRGPVGLNRVYLATDERTAAGLRTALASGRSFATNAPLLGLRVADAAPGDTLRLKADQRRVRVDAAVRSIVPLSDVELVFNGKIIRRLRTDRSGRSADFAGEVPVAGSGWLLLRAWNREPHLLVQDLYPYGTTNPVWIDAGTPTPAPEDARYFVQWIDRIIDAAGARTDYNTERERERTLEWLRAARAVYEGKAHAK